MKLSIRSILFTSLLAVAATSVPALGQEQFTQAGLTREGTVITNEATANFSDGNGNRYDEVRASATVTVGFLSNLDVTMPLVATPEGPSSGNTLDITVLNEGNGVDFLSLAFVEPEGLTNVSYKVAGITFPTLADLNAWLSLSPNGLAADGTLVITVVYDVADNYGGSDLTLKATVTSTKAPEQEGGSDGGETVITPRLDRNVTATADLSAIERLPSNGVKYTETFQITNTGNAREQIDISALANSGLTIEQILYNGSPVSYLPLDAKESVTVTVVYLVNQVDAGTSIVLTLTATVNSDATKTASGTTTVTVIRPKVTMTKSAFRDDQSTAIASSDRVLPGERIQYRLTVTNGGDTPATSVSLEDVLPVELILLGASADGAGWEIVENLAAGSVAAALRGELAKDESRFIWVRAEVQ
jgi:uncharacterized repeat protein (TIGR01451 family)